MKAMGPDYFMGFLWPKLSYKRRRLAPVWGALVDYALPVVSPASFARAESQSSLRSDSWSPLRSRLADTQPPSGNR
jgi:hypothetical protein